MPFEPLLFLDIAKELKDGSTEAHWRTSIGRSYYTIFGFVKTRYKSQIPASAFGKNTHDRVIDYFKQSSSDREREIGGLIESLFANRVNADYKYQDKISASFPGYSIKLAEKILEKFNALGIR